MDVSLLTPATPARDAVTPQTPGNLGANAGTNAGQSASPPPAAPLETATAVLSPAQATLVRLLSDAVRSATALQGGLAALLPDLAQAQGSVVIPPAVRAAIAGVINATTPLQALPSDAEITTALLRAGSPPPAAATTSTQSGAQPLPVPADIRAALQNLQQTLQQWAPQATATNEAPLPPSSSPQQAAVQTLPAAAGEIRPQATPAATAPAAQQLPAPATSASTAPLLPGSTPALPGTAQTLPASQIAALPVATQAAASTVTLATPLVQATAAQASEMGDAMASLLLLQQSAKSVTQAALRPRTATTRSEGTAPLKGDTPPGLTAALQLPKSQGRGLEPLAPVTRWPSNPDAAFVVRTLASRTENALTQVKLIEVATQMQRADDRQTAAAPEPRWSFDIPFQTPHAQSKAHFEIDRDTYKSAGSKDTRVWRVRFSIDVEPLGPVHTQIALMGKNAWVSIMAEREASMRTLEAQQQALLKEFGAQDLTAEVVCGVGKAPPRTSAASAGKLLDSAI